MNAPRHRPLSIGPLRAFEAVARRLSFRAAAEELHLTQPAISRQIRSLEDELGATLFLRGTRHVELTGPGAQLLQTVAPLLAQMDRSVRQIRHTQHRQPVGVTTFASFASLWLLPRLAGFQNTHPESDIRISASDHLVDFDDPEIDLALRYCRPEQAPPGSTLLFGEVLTPVASPALLQRLPLRSAADLAGHTLLEEDDPRPSAEYLSWRHWLRLNAPPALQPRGWVYLNFTYQQVQAALAGQGVALARVPLVREAIARGELVEPFGSAGRVESPFSYWLVRWPARRERPALAAFEGWLLEQAALTREELAREPLPA
ncbi:LysR substrate-binding domain-containing protein [Rubrivivax rivuli]|uniref:LysR family transcriptional regulator n=1 Tax=Rubrivivax rivuli TaxID=1862385 RepID=A0A437RM74_9BURK|nr:LysR substrate-binding domain-containing protein [Rubrivivax rivuli]RVU47675.1 LysR family transcriptional regulator [Rubrivivax rivuli]